jgi:hypothetical protein
MQLDPSDSEPQILSYQTPPKRARVASTAKLSASSLLCVAVPIIGVVIRSTPLFLLGLPLSIVGLGLGVTAAVLSAKASSIAPLAIIATTVNSLSFVYFIWLFFLRGI